MFCLAPLAIPNQGGKGEGAPLLQKSGVWSKVATKRHLLSLASCALADHFPSIVHIQPHWLSLMYYVLSLIMVVSSRLQRVYVQPHHLVVLGVLL